MLQLAMNRLMTNELSEAAQLLKKKVPKLPGLSGELYHVNIGEGAQFYASKSILLQKFHQNLPDLIQTVI